MICPRCEIPSLTELDRQGITIDRCDRCRGVWLDRGELEKLVAREAAAGAGEREAAPVAHRAQEPEYAQAPRRYARADSDHDHDDDHGERRGQGKRRSWWEIFD